MRAFAVSMHLSRPSASFCTIAYWLTSCAIAVRTLRFGRRLRTGRGARQRAWPIGCGGELRRESRKKLTPSACRLEASGSGGTVRGAIAGNGEGQSARSSGTAKRTAEVVVGARCAQGQKGVRCLHRAFDASKRQAAHSGKSTKRRSCRSPERSLRAAGKRARETTCERGRGSRRGSKRRRTADRLELVAEVLAAGLGRVEIRLDHLRRGAETRERGRGGRGASTRASSPCRCRGARRGRGAGGADSSLQSEGRRVRKSRGVGTVADQGEQNARIRDTPSYGTRCSRRTSKCILRAKGGRA